MMHDVFFKDWLAWVSHISPLPVSAPRSSHCPQRCLPVPDRGGESGAESAGDTETAAVKGLRDPAKGSCVDIS